MWNPALIVALTADNQVLLKNEYRYAYGTDVIECPAGMVEDGEDPKMIAERELYEETGYRSDNWTHLGSSWELTSKLTNTMHLFVVPNCRKVSSQNLDINEHLTVTAVPLGTAVCMVIDSQINTNNTAHALLRTARIMGE